MAFYIRGSVFHPCRCRIDFYCLDMWKILLSGIPVLTREIGSWTNRVSHLQFNSNFFDFIVSPDKHEAAYSLYSRKRKARLPAFWRFNDLRNKLKFRDYTKKIDLIIARSRAEGVDSCVWIVIDDLGLLYATHKHLKGKGLRKKHKIVFSYHGFELVLEQYNEIVADKVLFLTESGYQETVNKVSVFPSLVGIVGNGVDPQLFHPISPEEKLLQKELNHIPGGKTVISWLSNNRPKKGLHLFEKIKENLVEKYPDLFFLIIGTDRVHRDECSWYLGKMPNFELAKYLQISDFYFFTTLCQEGFGLSLIEALKCGNICLASKIGGVPEVLKNGELGFLVENPHIVKSWLYVFEIALREKFKYQTEEWCRTVKESYNYEDWARKFTAEIGNIF